MPLAEMQNKAINPGRKGLFRANAVIVQADLILTLIKQSRRLTRNRF
jgi:hypothetical protein